MLESREFKPLTAKANGNEQLITQLLLRGVSGEGKVVEAGCCPGDLQGKVEHIN